MQFVGIRRTFMLHSARFQVVASLAVPRRQQSFLYQNFNASRVFSSCGDGDDNEAFRRLCTFTVQQAAFR